MPKRNSKPQNKQKTNQNRDAEVIKISNMHRYYYNDYFTGLDINQKQGKNTVGYTLPNVSERNKAIISHKFVPIGSPLNCFEENQSITTIELEVLYPGLMVGVGYEHDVSAKESLKGGFSFDYVTGLPYIPGSSVKGVLRNYFPNLKEDEKWTEKDVQKLAYIKGIVEVESLSKEDIVALGRSIFEHGDVFLDAFPKVDTKVDNSGNVLLAMEYITPHTGGEFAEPVPIPFVKIRPGTKMVFSFIFNGDSGIDKKTLFTTILQDMGIGAKTNVGFGQLK